MKLSTVVETVPQEVQVTAETRVPERRAVRGLLNPSRVSDERRALTNSWASSCLPARRQEERRETERVMEEMSRAEAEEE